MVEAVVFDLDGVLIDSEETWSQVRAAVVARHGGRWTEADQQQVMGDNSRQWSAYITRRWALNVPDETIFREVLEAMIAAYRRELRVLPGAREAAAALAGRYPLAVASSSPRELIAQALDLAGMAGSFRAVVSSDDVAHGKPSPDVYLLAADRLGTAPTSCAAVEDSTNGIRAALAAGMTTIAIPNHAYPPAAEVLAMAAAELAAISELTPQFLERFV